MKELMEAGVRQELDTRIRALEAMIKSDKRPPKERETEVSSTPLVEEIRGIGGKKPQTDNDSTEIGPTGAYRRSQ